MNILKWIDINTGEIFELKCKYLAYNYYETHSQKFYKWAKGRIIKRIMSKDQLHNYSD
jgi:hypothetical protein